ncbi:MAG: Ribosomal protein [Pseudomonadota bacterium]|jgi:large subunit ribosomal protein L33|nr:50S ribosomal protein L33 [Betaproteobacteria bacterium]
MRELIKLVGIDEKGKPTGSVYVTDKNKKTTTKKIELKKYCKFTKKHILHREAKI